MSTITRTVQEPRDVRVVVCDGCGRDVGDVDGAPNRAYCEICCGDLCDESCRAKGRWFEVDGEDTWVCEFCAALVGKHVEIIERASERYEALLERHMEAWRNAGQMAGLKRQAERRAKG